MASLDDLIAEDQAKRAATPAAKGPTKTLDDLIAEDQARRSGPSGMDRAKSNLNASASGFIEGIPIVGGALNEGANMAEAALRSHVLNPAARAGIPLGGDPTDQMSYSDELQKVRATEARDNEANPGTHTLGKVGGAVTSLAPLAAAAPAAFGIDAGAGTGINMLRAGGTNAGIFGADQAVKTPGDPNAIALSTALGFGGGALSPLLSVGASNVADALSTIPEAMQALTPAARRYAASTMGDSGRYAPQIEQRLQQLGPLATLADASPEWLMTARGAAATPGARNDVTMPLLNRQAGAQARLEEGTAANLGPDRGIKSIVEGEITPGKKALGARYNDAMDRSPSVDPTSGAQRIDALIASKRGPAQSALRKVREMLNDQPGGSMAEGTDLALSRDPRVMHETRQAIDGMISKAKLEGDGKVVSALQDARSELGAELQERVPGMRDLDNQYSELARQEGGLDKGQALLDTGRKDFVRPEELRQQLVDAVASRNDRMAGPSAEAFRMKQGLRAEIGRKVGTEANDLQALRRTMGGDGDAARGKMAQMFGDENTDAQLALLDREQTFANTNSRVTAGSDTAGATGFREAAQAAGKPFEMPTNTTATGLLGHGASKVLRAILSSSGEQAGARFASQLGRLAVAAQGPERDAAFAAMRQLAEKTLDPKIQAIVAAMTSSGRVPAQQTMDYLRQ